MLYRYYTNVEKAASAQTRNCTTFGSPERYGARAPLMVSSVKKKPIDNVFGQQGAKLHQKCNIILILVRSRESAQHPN